MLRIVAAGIAAAVTLPILICTTPAAATDLKQPPAAAPETVEAPYISPLSPSCYVQGLGGAGINGARASDGSGTIESVSASGWMLAVGIGCDARIGRVVVGVLGRYEIPVEQDKDLFEAKGSYTGAVRAGYMLNTHLMLYGLAGISGTSWQIGDASQDAKGLVLGGGAELSLTDHVSMTLEYTNTQYGKWTEGALTINPEAHAMRVGLNYRFGTLFGK